jgi:hypothetical protein
MEKVKKTVLFRVSSQGTNFTGAKYLSQNVKAIMRQKQTTTKQIIGGTILQSGKSTG